MTRIILSPTLLNAFELCYLRLAVLQRGQSSDGEVVIQHMCRCLSSFDAFLDASTSFEKAEQASSLTLDSIVDLGANVGECNVLEFNGQGSTGIKHGTCCSVPGGYDRVLLSPKHTSNCWADC